MTALHLATKQGNHNLINLLLSNCADAMVQDAKRCTALHYASQRGDLEAYKMLVGRCYQSLTSIDSQNKTPIEYARDGKHNLILEYDKKMTVTLFSHKSKQGKLQPSDFEMIMPLGRGAFGRVILVSKDNQYYAMKIMKKRKYNGLLNLVLTEKEV